MKVLVINTSDISGGAARAAYHLHEGLHGLNLDRTYAMTLYIAH
jgi:hypothetical protein